MKKLSNSDGWLWRYKGFFNISSAIFPKIHHFEVKKSKLLKTEAGNAYFLLQKWIQHTKIHKIWTYGQNLTVRFDAGRGKVKINRPEMMSKRQPNGLEKADCEPKCLHIPTFYGKSVIKVPKHMLNDHK